MRPTKQAQRERELAARARVHANTARKWLRGYEPASFAIQEALARAAAELGIEREAPAAAEPSPEAQ